MTISWYWFVDNQVFSHVTWWFCWWVLKRKFVVVSVSCGWWLFSLQHKWQCLKFITSPTSSSLLWHSSSWAIRFFRYRIFKSWIRKSQFMDWCRNWRNHSYLSPCTCSLNTTWSSLLSVAKTWRENCVWKEWRLGTLVTTFYFSCAARYALPTCCLMYVYIKPFLRHCAWWSSKIQCAFGIHVLFLKA